MQRLVLAGFVRGPGKERSLSLDATMRPRHHCFGAPGWPFCTLLSTRRMPRPGSYVWVACHRCSGLCCNNCAGLESRRHQDHITPPADASLPPRVACPPHGSLAPPANASLTPPGIKQVGERGGRWGGRGGGEGRGVIHVLI